jgi:hypothetical protein
VNHSKYIFIFSFCFLVYTQLSAQLIKKDEKLRLGIGIAGLASSQIDRMIDEIEEETARLGPKVTINPFKDNLTYFFEYSHDLGEDFAYQLNIQYNSGNMSNDQTDLSLTTRQGMLFEYTIYEVSFDLVYYLPVFMIGTSQTSLVLGVGPDLSYVETLSLYYLNRQPAFVQSVRCKRNGGIPGARFYLGWDIPYVESFSIQFRAGYTYRREKKLPAETEELLIDNSESGFEHMDPAFFESFGSYNLSQIWFTFSMAYRF